MRSSINTALAVFFSLLFASTLALAQDFAFEVSAGPDSVTADIQTGIPFQGSTICLGGGGLYVEDDFSLMFVNAGVKQSLFDPALAIGLGFKGVAGEVEKKIRDFDVSAIGFSVLAEYDLSRTAAKLPLAVYAAVSAASDPMSFQDATDYREYSTGVHIQVIENGAIVARYTRLEFDLEKSNIKTDKTEDLFFMGLRFSLGL